MESLFGSAGTRGVGVRSDAWVQVERAHGMPKAMLSSRVEALYGDSIRDLIASTLETLGAQDLSLTMEDSGALPFVLMARIEASVRRLRPDTGAALPPRHPSSLVGSSKQRTRHTRLYLPGNTPRFFINAGLYKSDAVILDLEDSVAPDEKDAARVMVRNALRAVDFYGAERMVRINRGPMGLDDVRATAPHGAQAYLLPKVEEADEVGAVSVVLDALQQSGETAYPIQLIPIAESAKGVLNALEIVSASPRVAALAIGLEDYTTDIGAQRSADGRESLWARSKIVNAARAAGIQPLASIYSDVDDTEGFVRWVQEAKQMGFDGVGCLHPRQVARAHAAFAPSPVEVERARRIVAAFDDAKAAGQAVVSVDGKMVDAPIVERAQRVLRAIQT
jgi:citrate lyase subunit beta/citryl-CoA lyase